MRASHSILLFLSGFWSSDRAYADEAMGATIGRAELGIRDIVVARALYAHACKATYLPRVLNASMKPINPGIKEKTAFLVGILLVILFVVYAPIIPRNKTIMVEVLISKPGSSMSKQALELTVPLTTATFHIQTLDIPYRQRINVTVGGTGQSDLIAILSHSNNEAFIQSLITEVGIPIGPTLFTGTDITPIIISMIKEKLPSIIEGNANGDYYRLNTQKDVSSSELEPGTYNIIILSLGQMGETILNVEYQSSEFIRIEQPQMITEQVSILEWLIG